MHDSGGVDSGGDGGDRSNHVSSDVADGAVAAFEDDDDFEDDY